MAVKFEDRSVEVKAALNSISIGWLHEWAHEITAHARRNCSTGEEYSSQLRGSYSNVVDEAAGKATIGSPLEQAFWEEFGEKPVSNQNRAKSVNAKLLKIIILY